MTQEQVVLALQAVALVALGLVGGLLVRTATSRLLRAWGRRFSGTMGALFGTRAVEGPATVVLSSLLFWVIFVFALAAATERVGVQVIGPALAAVAGYLPRVVATVLIVMLGLLIADLARTTITGAAVSARMSGAGTLGRMAQLAILLATTVVAFEQLGIETTFIVVIVAIGLAALLGGAAVAFGLGARTTVANIIASYYVMKTYRVGQSVRIGDVEGRILEITSTAVLIGTRGGQVLVPAKEFSERSSVTLAEE